MQVWDGVTDARISFDWNSSSATSIFSHLSPSLPVDSTIAFMIENLNLTSSLLNRLADLPPITTYSSTRVEDITLGPPSSISSAPIGSVEPSFSQPDLSSWPHLTLSNKTTLAARLLIGADGANSPVRTFAGIPARGWDYGRHGVVATLRLSDAIGVPEANRKRTAYQRFLPTGPIALLPLPGEFASLVWSTTPERATFLKSLGSDDFVAMVNSAFRLSVADIDFMHNMPSSQVSELEWRLRHTSIDETRMPTPVVGVQDRSIASFPLKLRHADTYTGERIALVGDAAHTIHPLAGQGLNLGLGDAEALRDILVDAVRCGADIGSTISLEGYNEKRWAKNNAVLGVCDKLHMLYSVKSGPVVGLRSLGLGLIDKLGVVKGGIMKAAAGIA
jgi:ubiquinone biosynthesis monooxygenase Coq6